MSYGKGRKAKKEEKRRRSHKVPDGFEKNQAKKGGKVQREKVGLGHPTVLKERKKTRESSPMSRLKGKAAKRKKASKNHKEEHQRKWERETRRTALRGSRLLDGSRGLGKRGRERTARKRGISLGKKS